MAKSLQDIMTEALDKSFRQAYDDAINKACNEKIYHAIKRDNNTYELLESTSIFADDVVIAKGLSLSEIKSIVKMLPQEGRIRSTHPEIFE
jgi:hypothetical protein